MNRNATVVFLLTSSSTSTLSYNVKDPPTKTLGLKYGLQPQLRPKHQGFFTHRARIVITKLTASAAFFHSIKNRDKTAIANTTTI